MTNNNSDGLKRGKLKEPLYSLVEAIRSIFNANAAVLYLISEEMDPQEKQEIFHDRFGHKIPIKNRHITKEETKKYSVLRFIGVAEEVKENGYWGTVSYNNLPDKYVVIHRQRERAIPKEGITGKSARTKKLFTEESAAKIDGDRARNKLKDDTARGIHPRCKRVIAIPLVFDSSKLAVANGVLRLDIYEDDRSFTREALSKLKNNPDYRKLLTNILNAVIKDSFEGADLYKDLYKGEKLLNSIKKLEETGKIKTSTRNKKVFSLLKHLFFVFQRNTYIGHEEIMQRILNFVDDLCDVINLPPLPFREQLSLFKKQEDLLLYDVAQYRDHFMHQFHVFTIGYIMINHLGLHNVAITLNKRLKHVPGFSSIRLDNDSVLRIWILTAFYHDISYIFEKYDKGIEKFMNDLLEIEQESTTGTNKFTPTFKLEVQQKRKLLRVEF